MLSTLRCQYWKEEIPLHIVISAFIVYKCKLQLSLTATYRFVLLRLLMLAVKETRAGGFQHSIKIRLTFQRWDQTARCAPARAHDCCRHVKRFVKRRLEKAVFTTWCDRPDKLQRFITWSLHIMMKKDNKQKGQDNHGAIVSTRTRFNLSRLWKQEVCVFRKKS